MARRRTTQLDLDRLAQLRWHDLPPGLRDRLGELLANLLRQVATNADIAEADDHE